MISLIEKEYNLRIEEEKITEKTTVAQLERIIRTTEKSKEKLKSSFLNTSKIIYPVRILLQILIFPFISLVAQTKVEGKENLKLPYAELSVLHYPHNQ